MKTDQEVLASVKRPGWAVTARRPEMKPVHRVDPTGAPITEQVETGNEIWFISSPDGGQVDRIIVQPPPARVGAGTTDEDAAYAASHGAGYTVLEGPTKEVPVSAAAANKPSTANEQNEAALNDERSWNAANGKWGRVTHAERAALEKAEANAQRQLTNDERNATLAREREDRLAADARADNSRAATNAANSNQIARDRLALDQQNANKPNMRVVGNQLVDDSGRVLYTAPEGAKFQTAQDGTILMVDPANPTQPQVVWKPTQVPQLLSGQKPDQQQFVQQDPATGALSAVQNPIYQPEAIKQWQQLQDGITAIEGMWTRGEINPTQAQQYKTALQKNFDAALRGTTPYQEYQDQQARQQQRMQSGQSLLNQRVVAGSGLAQSLLGSAVGIVGNKNFMDPSAVAGLSIFQGAQDYATGLGGGQGVYDAAAGAVKGGLQPEQSQQAISDPAMSLLQAAMSNNSQPPQQAQPQSIMQPGVPIERDQTYLNDRRHMPPPQPMAAGNNNDIASILIQAALRGGLQSF